MFHSVTRPVGPSGVTDAGSGVTAWVPRFFLFQQRTRGCGAWSLGGCTAGPRRGPRLPRRNQTVAQTGSFGPRCSALRGLRAARLLSLHDKSGSNCDSVFGGGSAVRFLSQRAFSPRRRLCPRPTSRGVDGLLLTDA